VAGSVTRTYDTDFRVASESVNGGNSVTFQYDPDSLLTGAGSLTLTRHAQHGLLTGTVLGALTDTYSYSTFGELSRYQASYSGSPLLNTQYTRDSLGRITEKVETISGVATTTVYGYDTAGRLTDVSVDGTLTAHYDYDSNGNRLSVIRPTGTVTGSYDAQDRLVTYGAVGYTYTANGDLLTATSGGGVTTYNYDVFGNLVSVGLPDGSQIEYVIDGQNRRIGKKMDGVLTQGFLYSSQLRPVAELDGTGTVVSRFVYGTKVNVPEYMVKAGVTYRIITDHLGSVRLVVDTATGTIVQRIDYDEFGQITLDTNPGFQPLGFAGGLYDPDTKLVRFGARDYDAFPGRWTTKDPIGFRSRASNMYGYLNANPVQLTDPTGLLAWVSGAGLVAVVPKGKGIDVSGGGYYDTGSGEVGGFLSGGEAVGLNISADVFFGAFWDVPSLQGTAENATTSVGPWSITVMTDPATGRSLGATLGYGWSALPVGYSIALTHTVTATWADILKWLRGLVSVTACP